MHRTTMGAALVAGLAALACPWAASANTATLTADCAAGHAATQGFRAPAGTPLNWTRTVDGQPSGAGQVPLAPQIDLAWSPPLTGTHTLSWRLSWNTGVDHGAATSPTVTVTCAPAPPAAALAPPPPPPPPPEGATAPAPPPETLAGSDLDAIAVVAAVATPPGTLAVLPAAGHGVKAKIRKAPPLTCRQRIARHLTRPGRCTKVLAKRPAAVAPRRRAVQVAGSLR